MSLRCKHGLTDKLKIQGAIQKGPRNLFHTKVVCYASKWTLSNNVEKKTFSQLRQLMFFLRKDELRPQDLPLCKIFVSLIAKVPIQFSTEPTY